MNDMGDVRGRVKARKYVGIVWILVWMWPLLGPIVATARGQVHPLLPAVVGLVLFPPLYVIVVVAAIGPALPIRRVVLALLALLAADGLALTAGYAGQPGGWLIVLMYVGVAGIFTLRTPAQTIAWLAGSVGAQVTIGLLEHVSGGELGSIAFTSFMSGLLVYVVKQMNLLIDQLRATQAELAQAAVAEERLRFSRDLHDLLGHTLSLVVVKAEVVRRLIARDPVTAEREAGDIETIGRRALVEVREAVTGYRDRSFAAELDGARSALADAGIAVTVRETGDPLPAVADDVFGWAVREGVTNVIRHSQAQNCEIEVRREACRATLEIRDDGVGAVAGADAVAPDGHDGRSGLSYRLGSGAGRSAVGGLGAGGLRPGGPGAGHRAAGSGPGGREAGHRPLTGLGRGHGLRGLSERVQASGGTLIATPVPAGGFRLTASIPVPALVDPRLPASPEKSGSGVKDSISG